MTTRDADPTFTFLDPGSLHDAELELICTARTPANPITGFVPSYTFEMRVNGKHAGGINLRIGNTPHLTLYGGHIGYGVNPEHRGHHYAERACRLILPLARAHRINPLWDHLQPRQPPLPPNLRAPRLHL